jgi:hypothetical protein
MSLRDDDSGDAGDVASCPRRHIEATECTVALIAGSIVEVAHGSRLCGAAPSALPVTGESAKETVKTIARGMPGLSGVTVVTNSRVFFYTRGCGRIERPAFPAPSDL